MQSDHAHKFFPAAVRWLRLAAFVSAGLASLVGCGDGRGSHTTPAELRLVSTNPASGATGVAVASTVSATFSENLASTPTLTVTGGAGAVTGTITLSAATATFTPATPLAPSTTYTASVSGGSGVSGGAQSGTTTWSFTTAANPIAPAINLSSTALAFSATSLGANPQSQTVTISNSGGGSLTGLSVGTLSYGAGASGWLQAPTLDSTSAPATLTVQPLTGSLAAGSYTATIPIVSATASNSPRTITVTFSVVAAPLSVVSTNPANGATGVAVASMVSATFSDNLATTPTLTVTGGAGAVTGTITRSAATATFTPATPLAPSTTYTASVSGGSGVSGGAQSGTTNWSFTTAANPIAPAINLSSTALAFNATSLGANPQAQAVTISNSGGGSLTGLSVGTLSYGAGASGWLQAPTLDSTSAPATLTVQPLTGSLAAGSYTATIPIVSAGASNSPRTITVTFSVVAAPLSVVSTNPANGATGVAVASMVSATFSDNLATTPTLTVTGGAGAVTGTITRSAATATFTPATPLAPSTTYTASVSGGSGVSGGAQSGTTNWSFTTAAMPPAINLSSTALAFNATSLGANPQAQAVTISNSGGGSLTGLSVGTLSYGAGASGWLQAPTLDSTSAPATLTVQPLTGSLAAGSYTATIPIVSAGASNSPRTITVTFSVVAAPLNVVSTNPASGATGVAVASMVSATFSDNLATTPTLTVTGGAGAVTGTLTRSAATATFTPATPLAPSTTYTASVSGGSGVSGGAQSGTTNWSFTTAAMPPAINLSSTALAFNATSLGANPQAQAVTISNSGGGSLTGLSVGTLSYGAGASGWLQAPTLDSTSAPATLTVQPLTGSLAAGSYTATIPIVSAGASNSPRTITVTFSVVAAPLNVVSTNPANGATGVAVASMVSATFSDNLATTPTLTVTGGAGAVTGTITRSAATATFTPATPLAPSTTYTASVSGGSGVSGGAQSGTTNWSFTTAANPIAPAINLSSTALAFSATPGGANPQTQTVTISNSGGGSLTGLSVGTLSYGAGASGWLQAPTLDSTSAPATLTVQPLTGSLAAGSYTATIPIVSATASNSPRTVTVSFTVAAVTISGLADFQSVPNDTAVSGRLLYANTTNKALRGATVQLIAAASGAVLASGTTSATGTYSLTLAAPSSVFVRVRAELLKTTGSGGQWNFTVRDNTQSDALYVLDSAAFTPASGANTLNLRANSGWGGSSYTATRVAAPFSILDVMYDAKEKVLSASPDASFPTLQLMWSVNNVPANGDLTAGLIGTSFFQSGPNGNRIYILGAADSDTDEYDRSVIAHEFGHYLQSVFSRNDGIGGSHGRSEKLDMRVAFSEGWGNAWSGMALATQYYTDSNGVGQQLGLRIDLASSTTSNRGWFSEGSVQYLMYLWHATGGIGFIPIFNTMSGLPTSLLADGALSSIHSFAYRLRPAVPAQASTIDALLASQLITVLSPTGDGETNAGGISEVTLLPIYKDHSVALGVAQQYCVTDQAGRGGYEGNKLGAHVYIRIPLAAAAQRTISVIAVTAGSDPDFTHISPAGVKTSFSATNTGTETATLDNVGAGMHLVDLFDYALVFGTDAGTNNGPRCFNLTVQ